MLNCQDHNPAIDPVFVASELVQMSFDAMCKLMAPATTESCAQCAMVPPMVCPAENYQMEPKTAGQGLIDSLSTLGCTISCGTFREVTSMRS